MIISRDITETSVVRDLFDGDNPKKWVLWASATTADGTQCKHLSVAVGVRIFRVQRRYIEGDDGFQTIYQGADLADAVRQYNQLS